MTFLCRHLLECNSKQKWWTKIKIRKYLYLVARCKIVPIELRIPLYIPCMFAVFFYVENFYDAIRLNFCIERRFSHIDFYVNNDHGKLGDSMNRPRPK